ncbi:hypothetical protein [Aureibacillus halotolerans]|uniref:Uncharacterized protein n=1 Tax=Aureibacillus halotolerans TaxID=1508390 RepID=A0A4R6TQY3_9BACI|nr:hypothetical protein [Aureibacillus halotolerans]TDQ34630.1 hypothetical protein EV213_12448 [Aureibacillus halotolerans]
MNHILAEHKDNQMLVWHWLVNAYGSILLAFIGIGLATLPVYLFWNGFTGWGVFASVGLIGTVIIFRIIINHYQRLLWYNRHQNHFVLTETQLTYDVKDFKDRKVYTGTIALSDVECCDVMIYLSYAYYTYYEGYYKKGPFHRLVPCLLLQTKQGISIPVYLKDYEAIDQWLTVFHNTNIPIYMNRTVATEEHLQELKNIANTDEKENVPVDLPFAEIYDSLNQKWIKEEEERAKSVVEELVAPKTKFRPTIFGVIAILLIPTICSAFLHSWLQISGWLAVFHVFFYAAGYVAFTYNLKVCRFWTSCLYIPMAFVISVIALAQFVDTTSETFASVSTVIAQGLYLILIWFLYKIARKLREKYPSSHHQDRRKRRRVV